MNPKYVMKLALKVSGIYVLVQAIQLIPSVVLFIGMFNQQENSTNFGFYGLLVTFVLLLVLGLFLVFLKVPKSEVSEKAGPDLMHVGLAIAGVIVFVLALSQTPLLIGKFVEFYTAKNQLEYIGLINPFENLMDLIGNVIQLVIGALFFFKAKYFAKLVK